MRTFDLHPWDVSATEAARLQRELRQRVSLADELAPGAPRTVAGVDISYRGRGVEAPGCAAAVVLSLPELELIETRIACRPITFPYVPGLLSFRETPAMLAALAELEQEPDVVLVDAQGIAHPRRLGAASHLGLCLDRPTIGCAKSRLVGEFDEPGPEFGARSPLVHRGEVVGAVVRTRPGHAPLFVSPGHRIGLERAVEIVLACCRQRSQMPEPTRLADQLSRERARAS